MDIKIKTETVPTTEVKAEPKKDAPKAETKQEKKLEDTSEKK